MSGTVAEPQHQGDLHLRLRRREPAAGHGRQDAEHRAALVARRRDRSPTPRTAAAAPNIFISHIFQGTLDEVTKGDQVGENWLPAWSPDGTRLAFSSTRDGNPEIYVVNRDGSNLRRLTNHPGIDITPTWSPDRDADRVHVRSHRHAADLRGRRRRAEPGQADLRRLLRPADLVAGAVQRDRVTRRAAGPDSTSD